MEAFHRRAPRQARHARRRDFASTVYDRHCRQRQEDAADDRPDSVLPEIRRERVGGRERLPRRVHRCRGGAGDQEVHRGARRRRRLYCQHDVLGHGVAPPRPGLRVVGASVTTATRRDPRADHLITPENPALIVIDYQPSQVAAVRSMDHDLLLKNMVSTAKIAKTFGLPIVHSTVNVASGRQKPTVPELAAVLEGNAPIDRTSLNSWEDADFVAAVRSTGRRKLIFCALWTEICMAFPALDALREGFEVYPVVDAIGGTSLEAHRAGLERVTLAGGQPISWVSLACELQRDWARVETVPQVIQIVLSERLLKE